PGAELKINLYLKGQEILTANGYTNIGMDHFALPHDELYAAWKNGTMHRNFMGYTYHQSTYLLGLGVSSISDIGTGFAQNEKALHDYYAAINNGDLAITKGYFLNEEDQAFRQYILDIICNGETSFKPEHLALIKKYSFPILEIMKQDGLVEYDEKGISLTLQGQFFQRNVCSAFDMFLHKKNDSGSMPQFSKAI
ncbi:MAG: coproporphyrinogen III oxidase, partial [Chitinophagaceae bacterium]|nr:coproporphyrinogen III oxidase [Chitinophagaceae bacterium]